MARKKTSKKISLPEFKTWLDGVRSMQPEDWHPSKENWLMILEQIENIKETVVVKEVPVQVPATPPEHTSVPTGYSNNPADYPAAPRLSNELMHVPEGKIQGTPTGDNGLLSLDIQDTSDGSYKSSFSD